MNEYCTNCGVEVPEGAAFCAGCGKAISRQESRHEQQAQRSAPAGTVAAATLRGIRTLPVGPARGNDRIIKWALGTGAILVAALFIMLPLLFYGSTLGLGGLLFGIVLATLPVPLYLALALWIDRYEKEPVWMLVGAFVWGASISFFFALLQVVLSTSLIGAFFNPAAGDLFASVVGAPIVEEGMKGLALLVLFLWKKDEFDGVMDGIVYAAMVGLGFATVENYAYYGGSFVEGGIQGALYTFVVRGVISPFGHPLFTSMTGIGLGLARRSDKTYAKFLAPVIGLIGAMVLHSLWNTAATFLPGLLGLVVLTLFLTVPTMVGVAVVAYLGLRREGRIVRHYLTPELGSGLITKPEYDALGSVRGRIGSSFHALSGGFGGWRAYSRFSQTATELAFHRDRVARGITSADVADREAAYVQLLRDLRGVPGTS